DPKNLKQLMLTAVYELHTDGTITDEIGVTANLVASIDSADGSGTTYIFTDYLSSVSADWQTKVGKGKSVNWPAGQGAKGNEAVATTIKQTPGAIGYVELAYILAPQRLAQGDMVVSGEHVDVKPGNAMPVGSIPIGTIVHNVEIKIGTGGQIARSAGTYVQIVGRDGEYVILRLNSSEQRLVHGHCMATIGAVSNPDNMNVSIGKAGRTRWMGWRGHVRGEAKILGPGRVVVTTPDGPVELPAPQVDQLRHVGRGEQGPDAVRVDPAHELVRDPVREVQVVRTAGVLTGVVAQFQELLDVGVPGLQVDRRGALRRVPAALEVGEGGLVRGDQAGPGARLDRHVADGQAALHRQAADGLTAVPTM
ncbi:50S ribosomal protein L2, partial [Lacticaseibacillus rhamnosus]